MSITNYYIRELFDDKELSNKSEFMYKEDTITFHSICFVCDELYVVGAIALDSIEKEEGKINLTLFRKKDRHQCQRKATNLNL